MDEITLLDFPGSYNPESAPTEYYYPARELLTTSPDPEAVSAETAGMSSFGDLFATLFGTSGTNFDTTKMNELLNEYKKFILENTNANNAWSAEQAQHMMDFQRSEREWSQLFNAGEAAKNRDWQKMMSDTAHQREIADLKAAGLNPVLSAKGGSGAAVGSGATAAASVPGHGAQGNPDQSANQAITGFLGTAFSAMSSMASKMVDAQTSLAVATKYTEMERIVEQMREEYGAWEHEHYPGNLMEAVSAIIGFLGGDGRGRESGALGKAYNWLDEYLESKGESAGSSGKKIYDWLGNLPAFNPDSWISKITRGFDHWLEDINPFKKKEWSGHGGKF